MDSDQRTRIICLGGSYTGRYLALNFAGQTAVTFLTRSPERLIAEGFCAIRPADVRAFGPLDLILDTVPAVKREGEIHLPYRSALAGVVKDGNHPTYVHLSTTAVYPPGVEALREEDLPTCDEDTLPDPQTDRARDRLLLEAAIAGGYSGARILRCGGIYGPGRSLAVRFGKGDFSRARSGNRMVTRIHVHDLCRLVLAVGRTGPGAEPRLINAVDSRASSNLETFQYLEREMGITVPGNWRTQPPRGRKVLSKYASALLGGQYRFPTYREGLADSLCPQGSSGTKPI